VPPSGDRSGVTADEVPQAVGDVQDTACRLEEVAPLLLLQLHLLGDLLALAAILTDLLLAELRIRAATGGVEVSGI
jgi:hypothetical protein